jgi:hypothetical protein
MFIADSSLDTRLDSRLDLGLDPGLDPGFDLGLDHRLGHRLLDSRLAYILYSELDTRLVEDELGHLYSL